MDFYTIVPSVLGSIALIYILRIVIGTFVKLLPKRIRQLPEVLPTVSVVIPCYNEGKGIYLTLESLSKADYPSHLFDVTVIDDCSVDDSLDWIKKGISKFSNINIKYIRQPINKGKQEAIITGFYNSSGDIFVLFDSDVVVSPSVLKAFVRELQDPKLGIVGASCGVYDVNRDLISQAYASVFYSLHEWMKQIESSIGCVSVVDGKSMGFRRSVYAEVLPIMRDREWLGLHMQAGEDRHVTHLITLRGYKSKMILERINTSAPPNLVNLYKQQLRWRRSGLRDFLWVVTDLPRHIALIGPLKTFLLMISRMYYLILPLTYLIVIYLSGIEGLIESHMAFLPILVGIRICLNVHAYFYQKDQVVNNPILTSIGLAAWMSVDMFITTMVAFLTLDEGGWGTRSLPSESANNNPSIVTVN